MQQLARKHWFRRYDWDAVAGIAAAAVALILHLLHLAQPDIVLTITLVLVALLLLRQLRHEEREERVEQTTGRTEQMMVRLQDALKLQDVVLVGPRQLRSASETFARQARGDMVWFNVCLMMFRPQELFGCLLRPAVENPHVTRIEFVLADREAEGHAEAQLSFWGEPFMARTTGRDVPRYVFHVQSHSELIPRLVELERNYRTARS